MSQRVREGVSVDLRLNRDRGHPPQASPLDRDTLSSVPFEGKVVNV